MYKIVNRNSYSRELISDLIDYGNKNNRQIVVVTDPPFNIGFKYSGYSDKMSEDDYYNMVCSWVRAFPSVIIHYPEALYKVAMVSGICPEKVISWVYNANTKKQHRDIAFFGITPDLSKVKQPYKNPNDKRIKKLIENGSKGTDLYDWWDIQQVKNVSKEKVNFPCQMPLEVMRRIVGILPDDCIILDPFMGSGSTGVAAEQCGHDFIGFELVPEYFEIAKGRIEKCMNTTRLSTK